MRSEPRSALDLLVVAAVCALDDTECSRTSALQPDSFFFIAADQNKVDVKDFAAVLRYCLVGEPSVLVQFSITGSGIEPISSLTQSITVECLPCQPGQMLVHVETQGRMLWTCQKCKAGKYVVNSSDALIGCQRCPIGAECSDGRLQPHVAGSVWLPSEGAERGQLRLVACPSGYALVNSLDGSLTGTFDHETQQCHKCAADQYILEDKLPCQDCPAGARCDGQPNRAGSRIRVGAAGPATAPRPVPRWLHPPLL